jgi:hypothetical protein
MYPVAVLLALLAVYLLYRLMGWLDNQALNSA